MSTEEISIKQLPAVTEINNDDLILVQTPTATNTLKFQDFVVGLENTTFAPTICANSSNIDFLSATFDSVFFEPQELPDGPNLLTKNVTSTTLSSFDTALLPIVITSEGQKKTYYFILSGTP